MGVQSMKGMEMALDVQGQKWRAQGDSNSRPLAPEAKAEALSSWFV